MTDTPVSIPAGSCYEFVVAEPQKREKAGALDLSYWTYQINTKTNLEIFKAPTMKAVRRYNDFVWLREALVEENPGVIVPPIPEKSLKGTLEKVSGGNNSSSPLRSYRQRAMRKFLVRVGAHATLREAKPFISFLELEEEAEFTKVTKMPKNKVEVELSMTQMMKMFSKPKSSDDGTWEETRQYVAQLESSLTMLKDRVELLVRRRRETGGSLKEFGKAFAKVGDIERSYEDGPLSTALVDVGHHSEHLAYVYGEQADVETTQVAETIGYYIGMCGAIKEIIKRLQKMSQTRDTLEHVLNNLNADKANAKDAKVAQIEGEIATISAKFEDAKKLAEDSAATFKDELQRFHREKQYDIKQMLKSFVELQLEYANKMKKSWETLLPSVDSIKLE